MSDSDDDDQNWNPRYVYYAKAHGYSPQERFAIDKDVYIGGCMTGFILWMNKKKAEFYEVHPEAFLDHNTIYDDAAWDDFLRKSSE